MKSNQAINHKTSWVFMQIGFGEGVGGCQRFQPGPSTISKPLTETYGAGEHSQITLTKCIQTGDIIGMFRILFFFIFFIHVHDQHVLKSLCLF